MKKIILNAILLVTLISSAYAQTGNVGIGTTSPDEKLEVNGHTKDAAFSTVWRATPATYTANYIVAYNGNFYRNLTGTNTATAPNADFTNWVNISSELNYLHAYTDANESAITNTDLDNLTVIAAGGYFTNPNSYDSDEPSVGVGFYVNLLPGVTYKLTAAFNKVTSGTADFVVYQWHDVTNSTYIGNRAVTYSLNFTSEASSQNTAVAYITPTAAIKVNVQIPNGANGTGVIDAEYGYITVETL